MALISTLGFLYLSVGLVVSVWGRGILAYPNSEIWRMVWAFAGIGALVMWRATRYAIAASVLNLLVLCGWARGPRSNQSSRDEQDDVLSQLSVLDPEPAPTALFFTAARQRLRRVCELILREPILHWSANRDDATRSMAVGLGTETEHGGALTQDRTEIVNFWDDSDKVSIGSSVFSLESSESDAEPMEQFSTM